MFTTSAPFSVESELLIEIIDRFKKLESYKSMKRGINSVEVTSYGITGYCIGEAKAIVKPKDPMFAVNYFCVALVELCSYKVILYYDTDL